MRQMNKMYQVQDDEIDVFKLFQTLWDGKWLISAFVAIAVLLGGGFLLTKDTVYESKVIYSVDSIPPFYDANKISTDFQKKFYSVSVFEEWKQNNNNTSLVFEDFSANEVVDGFILSKNEDRQLAKLVYKENVSFLLIKSNQLPILDDFFKYAIHVNGLLKDEYVVRAKDELNIIETRFKDFSTANDAIISKILTVDRYIVSAGKGAGVLAIQRPTMPKQTSPKPSFILSLFVVLGGIVGVFFILIRNAITKRKERLVKA